VEIYLTEVPSFALMYRPEMFHAVNESVWTNYPEYGDGNNIPPTCLANGYGVAGLYNLELVD
jgi:peptide/nickel transport system substrate-binding protein